MWANTRTVGKSFRSQKGSQIAVSTAIRVIRESVFGLNLETERISSSDITYLVENRLPQKIAYEWKETVKQHLNENPIQDSEWNNLKQQLGDGLTKQVEADEFIAYGATLLCVIVTKLFTAYLQLGDGDILCVDNEGKTTRPILKDESLIANETTSLCLKEAGKQFRCQTDIFYPEISPDKKPALILVSTDGLSNSYSSDEDFQKIGSDYLEIIDSEGIESVATQLENDLNTISTEGSGDDITLGMIVQQSVLGKGETENDEKAIDNKLLSDCHSRKLSPLSNSNLDTENLRENDWEEDMEKKNNKLSAIAIGLVLLFGAVGISFGVWSWFLLNDLQRSVTELEKSPLLTNPSPNKQIETINQRIDELETKIAGLTDAVNQFATEESEAITPGQSDRTSSESTQTTENEEGSNTEQ